MGAAGGLDLYTRIFLSGDDGRVNDEATVMRNDTPELEELAQKVMRDVAQSESTFRAWYGPAKEELRFYHGHQWDDSDRMRMEQLKRPALSFNEVRPVVNAVSGLERLNRTDCIFQSRSLESPVAVDLAGELATASVSASDDLCNAAEEDSDLARDVTVTGMGWGEVHLDFNHDVNGRVVFERLPNDEMRWPENCKRPNLEGSEWRARKRQMSRKAFEKLWPGKLDQVDIAVPEVPWGQTEKYELVTPYYSRANEQANPNVGQGNQKKNVEVIQYQWRDMQPIYRFQDQDSEEITTLNEDKWDRLVKRMEMAGGSAPPAVRQLQPVYRQVYVSRGVVLEDPVDLPGGFSLTCMTGEWDPEKKRFVGIVRDMIDPQKTKNKAISSALGFHITNAKGGVLFKTSAFADPDHARDQWSRFDAWIEVNDDVDIQGAIVQREPAKVSPDLGMFYQESTKALSRVTGINEEVVGIAAGQTPSQTARGRQQGGLIVLGWYFDNLNRHKRERAHLTLEFIREYWTQGQLMQVGGDMTNQAVPLLKESLPTDYTLTLDDSIRHNPNLKAQVWRELMESGVVQALLKFGAGQVLLQLLKFSPFPPSVVNMIQRTMSQMPPQPQKQGRGAQPKQPENPMLTQAKIQHTSAQAQKALAQAREIDMRTKSEPQDKQREHQMKVAELATEAAIKAHELRMKREERASRMAQLARQTGFEQMNGGPQQ